MVFSFSIFAAPSGVTVDRQDVDFPIALSASSGASASVSASSYGFKVSLKVNDEKPAADEWPVSAGRAELEICKDKSVDRLVYDLNRRVPRPKYVPGPGWHLRHRNYDPPRLSGKPTASPGRNELFLSEAASAVFRSGDDGGWQLTFEIPWWWYGGAPASARWRLKLSLNDKVLWSGSVSWPKMWRTKEDGLTQDEILLQAELQNHDVHARYIRVRDQSLFRFKSSYEERHYGFVDSPEYFAAGSLASDTFFLDKFLNPLFEKNRNLEEVVVSSGKDVASKFFSSPPAVRRQISERLDALRYVRREIDEMRRDYLLDMLLGRESKATAVRETSAPAVQEKTQDSSDMLMLEDNDSGLNFDLDEDFF